MKQTFEFMSYRAQLIQATGRCGAFYAVHVAKNGIQQLTSLLAITTSCAQFIDSREDLLRTFFQFCENQLLILIQAGIVKVKK